jgi:hypothetical protein
MKTQDQWDKIYSYNTRIKELNQLCPWPMPLPEDIKEQIDKIIRDKEDYILSIKPIEKPSQKPEYKLQNSYSYYDPTNLYCVEMAKKLKGKKQKSFSKAFSLGHFYVFDLDFIKTLFEDEDDAYDFFDYLRDYLPYNYYHQYNYAGNKAIERFIEECKQNLHNEPGTLEKIIIKYCDDLNHLYGEVELETQTRNVLFKELGKDLFDCLMYG